jgi:NADPH2:quinone reductase
VLGDAAVVRGPQGDPDRGITQHAVFVAEVAEDQAGLLHLRTLAQDGRIALRVADEVPMEAAADAQRRMDAGGLRGRIVITM